VAPRLISIPEAATHLSLSPWTIREMVWRGDLPHVRAGRRVLLDLHDLDIWIERQKAHGV
jgi:excisionase family DNA binding protein